VGLVLGGGAARGLAHIGVLDVLVEHQIPIHMLAGCSIGAVIGALYASGMSPQRMRVLLEGLNWGTLSTLSLYTMKLSELNLLTLKGLPLGLLDMDRMVEWLHKLWDGPLRFDELLLPFVAIATDVVSGEMVVMNEGEVAPAVRASCSVPGIFTPCRRNGRLLVDGGVIDNLPIQAMREMGAEYVIAVDLLPPPGVRRREPESIIEISLTSLYALVRASQVNAHGAADCVIAPDVVDTSLVDLTAFQELIAAGRAAAEAALPQLRADLGLQAPSPAA
jgi:NTE family protein